MDNPTDNHEILNADGQPNKRRRKKSIVWEHFTVQTVSAGCTKAYCKQCNRSFAYITGSKLAGTSHLKRHIALGICPESRRNQEKNQLALYSPELKTNGTGPPKKRNKVSSGSANIPFDQGRCIHEMAKMIILHEYPLNIVEHSGFINFVQALQPQFNMVSSNTIQGDCVALYLREKQSLWNLISGIPGRVSLTLELWTSDQTLGYVVLTGHFVDSDYKLNRRILNVVMVPCPDSDNALNLAVVSGLSDWGLGSKLFTLTLDESVSNETVMGNLRGLLSVRNPLMLNGQLVIGNCFARVISRLVQDALGAMSHTIKKVRDSVKYVVTSESHEEKFLELRQQLLVPSTCSLFIDDQRKWDTTYHMLVAACELKEVFACLDTSDPSYKESPSMDEWRRIETLCTYLKLFHDSANILVSTACPTANAFFHEVCKIQLELTHAAISEDPLASSLTRPLLEKFDKYWRDCCLVLAIAVVMDPRFKMKLVEFSFSKIYGEGGEAWTKMVDDAVHELFLEYITLTLPEATTFEEVVGNDHDYKTETETEMPEPDGASLLSSADGFSDFDVYISEISSSQQTRSELDQYLEESLLPRSQDLDVLNWWKVNKFKYPYLSKMACDVLSIPVSTVAPDSVFDTVSKKIDSYHSSLKPVTLEALVCTKDWLQYSATEISNTDVKMEF